MDMINTFSTAEVVIEEWEIRTEIFEQLSDLKYSVLLNFDLSSKLYECVYRLVN